MHRHRLYPSRTARPPRGVTLVVVLLILVVATILGIGGAQIALLGERSTRYDRDYLIASQSSEAALMDAEFDIMGPNTAANSRVAQFTQANTGIFVPNCGSAGVGQGLCEATAGAARPVWLTADFLDQGSATARTVKYGTFTGRQFDAGSVGVQPAREPRYMIEVIEDTNPGGSAKYESGKTKPTMYRITSMGFGPREDTQVVMQITFRKQKD